MPARRVRKILIPALALILALAVAGALFRLSKSRTFQFFGTLVTRVETDEMRLAMTIDDGPTERTGEILAALRELEIPATFFLCGEAIQARPEDAKAIAKRADEFKRERGRLPSVTSPDPWERHHAEGAAAFVRYKDEGRYNE